MAARVAGAEETPANNPSGHFLQTDSFGQVSQVAAGLVVQASLKQLGVAPKLSNDLLGLGFVWSQPSATAQTVYHEDEYAWETFYALQLISAMKLQPDLQLVWNPALNPAAGPALVFQLQLNLVW